MTMSDAQSGTAQAMHNPSYSCKSALDAMQLDHADRWDELPKQHKIAASLIIRTKDLGWTEQDERKQWSSWCCRNAEGYYLCRDAEGIERPEAGMSSRSNQGCVG